MNGFERRAELADLADRRRHQLVDVAIKQFGRNGYHATTIRDIAQDAGVSVGLIYQYFKDKEDLLFAAINEVVNGYFQEIPPARDAGGDALGRFRAAVHAYARVVDRNRNAATLAYRESWSLNRDRLKELLAREREVNRLIRACVDDCIADGSIATTDAEMLAYQIVVTVHAWSHSAWRLEKGLDVATYVERNLSVLLGPVLVQSGAAAD